MMYHQKLVACVKVDGKILRESGDSVSIPFGSEYSILLKNLNTVRVQVKVSIDGTEATEGTWLVIQPNSSVELERFIRNGNMNRGNRFKFIERTGKIEKHRGIGSDDGLIRIEYQTEKVQPIVNVPIVRYNYFDVNVPFYRPWWWGTTYIYGGTQYVCQNAPANLNLSQTFDMNQCDLNDGLVTFTTTSGTLGGAQTSSFVGSAMNVNSSPSASKSRGIHAMSAMRSAKLTKSAEPLNDAGITVAGSESDQQFHWASAFPVHATSEVLVIKLRGAVGGQKVARPVTVKTKPVCVTCGKKNRPTVKFCAECGTALTLL
jgi:hypothetical protein